MGVCSKQLAPWHIGLLPSMMVMNGDGDDDDDGDGDGDGDER